VTTMAYDGDDRETSVTPPQNAGSSTAGSSTAYDAAGNVTSATDAGFTTTYLYNKDNEVILTTLPGGGTEATAYGGWGQVLASTDANGIVTADGYDGDGRQISSAVGSDVTQTPVDKAGLETGLIDPVGNVTTFKDDANGNVLETVDQLGHVRDSTYNADGQVTLENGVSDTYDPAELLLSQSDGNSFTYNADGQVLTATNAYGTYSFTRDADGRVTGQTDPNGLTLTDTLDNNSNITSQTDSAGGTVTSAYDTDNRLTSRSFSETGAALRIELSYNAQSEITDEKRYNAASGGALVGETVQSFNGAGSVTEITHKDGSGNVLEDFTYSYDSGQRLTSETDTISGTAVTTGYTYGGDGQLASAGSSSYSLDAAGNRTSGTTIGPDNQLLADANWKYTYDGQGRLTEKDGLATGADPNITWKYGYDSDSRLTLLAEYTTSTGALVYQENDRYDVFGNRVEEDKTQNGTTTVTKQAYDANGMCYADISGTGSISTRRVNLDAVDALFARIGQTGTIAWYLTDHLGSVRGLMNNSSTLIDALSYDAYGNVTSETSPSNGDRYAYTGRERDVETGLQYNRARWYDPATGRWLSQDPLGFDAGDSNLYRYVNNQATVASDPSGLENFDGGTITFSAVPVKAEKLLVWVGIVKMADVTPGGKDTALAKTFVNKILESQKEGPTIAVGAGLEANFPATISDPKEAKYYFFRQRIKVQSQGKDPKKLPPSHDFELDEGLSKAPIKLKGNILPGNDSPGLLGSMPTKNFPEKVYEFKDNDFVFKPVVTKAGKDAFQEMKDQFIEKHGKNESVYKVTIETNLMYKGPDDKDAKSKGKFVWGFVISFPKEDKGYKISVESIYGKGMPWYKWEP